MRTKCNLILFSSIFGLVAASWTSREASPNIYCMSACEYTKMTGHNLKKFCFGDVRRRRRQPFNIASSMICTKAARECVQCYIGDVQCVALCGQLRMASIPLAAALTFRILTAPRNYDCCCCCINNWFSPITKTILSKRSTKRWGSALFAFRDTYLSKKQISSIILQ